MLLLSWVKLSYVIKCNLSQIANKLLGMTPNDIESNLFRMHLIQFDILIISIGFFICFFFRYYATPLSFTHLFQLQQLTWKLMAPIIQTLWWTAPWIMELAKKKSIHQNRIQFNRRWAHADAGMWLCARLYFYWNFLSHGIRWVSYLWHQTSLLHAPTQTSLINAQPTAPRTHSIATYSRKPFKWHGTWCAVKSTWPTHRKPSLCLAF